MSAHSLTLMDRWHLLITTNSSASIVKEAWINLIDAIQMRLERREWSFFADGINFQRLRPK